MSLLFLSFILRHTTAKTSARVVTTVATSEKTVFGKEVETDTAERYTGRYENDAVLVAAAGATDEHETSVSYFTEHVEFDVGLEGEAVTAKSS